MHVRVKGHHELTLPQCKWNWKKKKIKLIFVKSDSDLFYIWLYLGTVLSKDLQFIFFNFYHFSVTLCNIGLMSEIGFAFYVQFRTLQMQMIEQVLQGFCKHSEHPWLKWKQCCQLLLFLQKFSPKMAKPIYTPKIEFSVPLLSFEAFWRKSDIILDHVQFLHFENSSSSV